jgi:hypothetical protein
MRYFIFAHTCTAKNAEYMQRQNSIFLFKENDSITK